MCGNCSGSPAQVKLGMNAGGVKTGLAVDAHLQQLSVDGPALVGASPLFRQVLAIVDAVAPNDCIVLIEGESGTGKELLARRIHAGSTRRDMPFIPVNCPGISETLFESQFYGHVKGAFTGAASDTLGVVRAADGGTLLLDEVGELPIHLQPKLLRLLQEHEVTPVGASRPIKVDARFVVSTNRSLAKCVSEGTFRSDLYHRLNIVRIVIPPLRSRPEDIEPLLDYYLAYFAELYRMPVRLLSSHLRRILCEHPWSGNVRELCGYVERLYAANIPPMPPATDVWEDGYVADSAAIAIDPPPDRMPLGSEVCCTLADSEAIAIRRALEAAGFNHSAAARRLAIHRSTLLRKMRLYGMR